MIYLIGIGIFVILLIVVWVYSFKYDVKQNKKAKNLFDDRILVMCNSASTIEECNDAWDFIMESCSDGEYFKIPREYQRRFYESIAYLKGKIDILNKINDNEKD